MKSKKQKNDVQRLVLGTAQIGMPYGIANRNGKPDGLTAQKILKTAWEAGITEFDTAQGYGNSEGIIGQFIQRYRIQDRVKIISKVHPQINLFKKEQLEESIIKSLEVLGIQQLYGLLLHREDLLDQWEKGLSESLQMVQEKGYVKHVGISCYSPEKGLQALTKNEVKIIQVPVNLLDHRFLVSPFCNQAVKLKIKVYARSIFLQGLFFLTSDDIKSRMKFAEPVINRLSDLIKNHNVSIKDIALGFVKKILPEAKVLFGAETVDQVKQNIASWQKPLDKELCQKIMINFNKVSERIINPVLWPRNDL